MSRSRCNFFFSMLFGVIIYFHMDQGPVIEMEEGKGWELIFLHLV